MWCKEWSYCAKWAYRPAGKSAWDCANEVLAIVQIVVTMIRMCCAGEMWLSYNAATKTNNKMKSFVGWIKNVVNVVSYFNSSIVPAAWNV